MPHFAVMSPYQDNEFIVNTVTMSDSLEDANETIRLTNLGSFCIQYDPNDINAPGVGFIWDETKFTDRLSIENIEIPGGVE